MSDKKLAASNLIFAFSFVFAIFAFIGLLVYFTVERPAASSADLSLYINMSIWLIVVAHYIRHS